jgi:hypothetical protein
MFRRHSLQDDDDAGYDGLEALSASALACSYCETAILSGSFRYCNANCKKLAKKQRQKAKREYEQLLEEGAKTQPEEVQQLLPSSKLVFLNTKHARLEAEKRKLNVAQKKEKEEEDGPTSGEFNMDFVFGQFGDDLEFSQQGFNEDNLDLEPNDKVANAPAPGPGEFNQSFVMEENWDNDNDLKDQAAAADLCSTPLMPTPSLLSLSQTAKRLRKFSFSSQEEVKALQETAKDQGRYLTESMNKHMKTSRNSFMDFCKAAYPDLNLQGLKSKDEEEIAQLVLEYCVAALQDCSQVEGDRPMLAKDSFRDTYIPNLVRWFETEKIRYPPNLKKRVGEKIKTMVKKKEITKAQLPDQKGANPLTVTDWKYILQTTPCGIEHYLEIMTWIAVSLHSAMRGITVINLKWKHIEAFEKKEIRITWECDKGNKSWNHTQMLSGSFENFNSPGFWLNHLWKQHERDIDAQLPRTSTLDEFVFQECGGMDLVFRQSSHAEWYRRLLQRVTTFCGYPPNFFTNHSTRSGSQISMYIKLCLEEKRTREAIWDDIALHVGYAPKSKNQAAYFRNRFQDVLQLNGVLFSTNDDEEPFSTMSRERFESIELFHNLPELKSLWNEHDRTEMIKKSVLRSARHAVDATVSKTQAQSMVSKFYKMAAKFETYDELIAQLTKSGEHHSKGVLRYFCKLVENKWETQQIPPWAVMQEILEQLWVQDCFIEAHAAFKPLGPLSQPKKPRKPSVEKKKSFRKAVAAARMQKEKIQHEERKKELASLNEAAKRQQQQEKKPKQTRRKWEDAETAILCQMVVDNNSGSPNWREISDEIKKQLQSERGNVHCKDRMRTLCLQLGDDNHQKAAQQWLDLHGDAIAHAKSAIAKDNAAPEDDNSQREEDKSPRKKKRERK